MPIRCAVPISHRLASKEKLAIQDLYAENFMLIRRKWNSYIDALRDELQEHTAINIVDIDFFNISIFNQCENDNAVLVAIDSWKNVHPLFKILPAEWSYTVPFGLLHAPSPSPAVCKFLNAIKSTYL